MKIRVSVVLQATILKAISVMLVMIIPFALSAHQQDNAYHAQMATFSQVPTNAKK